MSIWCSWECIGFDEPKFRSRKRPTRGGQVRSYAAGWSNHYPTTSGTVEQQASVDLAHVPVWCVPRHDGETSVSTGPWVRLWMRTAEHSYEDGGKPTGEWKSAAVVMDEAAARALAADLLAWADTPKAYPVKPTKRQEAEK